ncbi:hypothetical protein FGF66_04330 [Chlorobaculum thiosulfatiphilum]|uniref:Uncharacterized protein n=1 Tax=Chlorobaculum thiosulfatiphilum TaxID=115852 RepID=A0A5C4S725_CHLTI|nr:hypothetical protein [Chlorobaculum thiosulfatiphilum]TNJ39343.1 hypothetical protein FGF66_04330 [Chlorobaculum thiosulfatiphilum]
MKKKERLESMTGGSTTEYRRIFSNKGDFIKSLVEIVSVIALVVGAVIGAYSYKEYRYNNLININNALYVQDREIYKKMEGKKNVFGLFIQRSSDMSIIDGSNKLLESCAGNKLSFVWRDVPDLYEKLYQVDGFYNEDRVCLRDALDTAENILYLIYNVHDADVLTNHAQEIGVETWYAYIEEVGENPLFLAAIYKGIKYRYIDKEFARFLYNRMNNSKHIKETLIVIYHEMTNASWVDSVGEK